MTNIKPLEFFGVSIPRNLREDDAAERQGAVGMQISMIHVDTIREFAGCTGLTNDQYTKLIQQTPMLDVTDTLRCL